MFWVLTLCRLGNRDGDGMFLRSVGIYLHGVETQNIVILTAVKTSDLFLIVFPSPPSFISHSPSFSAVLPSICISKICYTLVRRQSNRYHYPLSSSTYNQPAYRQLRSYRIDLFRFINTASYYNEMRRENDMHGDLIGLER
jgi:hypothetical protein